MALEVVEAVDLESAFEKARSGCPVRFALSNQLVPRIVLGIALPWSLELLTPCYACTLAGSKSIARPRDHLNRAADGSHGWRAAFEAATDNLKLTRAKVEGIAAAEVAWQQALE